MDSPIFKIGQRQDARNDAPLHGVYTEDWAVSSYGSPTIIERGLVSLTGGTQSIYLPRALLSAASGGKH